MAPDCVWAHLVFQNFSNGRGCPRVPSPYTLLRPAVTKHITCPLRERNPGNAAAYGLTYLDTMVGVLLFFENVTQFCRINVLHSQLSILRDATG